MVVTGGSITLLGDKGEEKPVNSIFNYNTRKTRSDSCHFLGNMSMFCPGHFFIIFFYSREQLLPSGATFQHSAQSCLWVLFPK